MADAKKQRFGPGDLDLLLKGVTTLVGARGKKIIELDPSDSGTRDALEKLVIGPSGNLRAPAARAGNKFLVGYNDEMWAANL